MNIKRTIGFLSGPSVFLLTLSFFHPDGLSQEANAVLASTLWMAAWWVLEIVPIAMTALLPIVLFPMTGGLSLERTTACFGHQYIFLYIGGFILAIAIERWNLHKRIALTIIHLIGANIKKIILGFMMASGFISMWISNTATAVLMLPIGMAIIGQLKDNPETVENENLVFGKALMLAIAYSCSLGGMATLVGTPPNLVFASVVKDLYGIEITFYDWFIFGFPLALILILITWKYLTSIAFSFERDNFPGGREEISKQLQALGKMSYEEKVVLAVFVATAFAWISRSYLLNRFLPGLDDTMIALISATVLFLIPASQKGRSVLVTWDEAVKLPWGVLLLFGGGLAIAEGFGNSGLAAFIGSQMSMLEGVSLILILLVIIASVNFLTEVTSNLATTAMILPILAPLALAVDMHPIGLMAGAAVAASCAFMLPVATPPNAIVFGSGHLVVSDMVKVGFVMNLVSIGVTLLTVYFLLPLCWGYVPDIFPDTFKQ